MNATPARLKWTRVDLGPNSYWRAKSPKYGPVRIHYARKAKLWFLATDEWTGQSLSLGVFKTRQEAQGKAS